MYVTTKAGDNLAYVEAPPFVELDEDQASDSESIGSDTSGEAESSSSSGSDSEPDTEDLELSSSRRTTLDIQTADLQKMRRLAVKEPFAASASRIDGPVANSKFTTRASLESVDGQESLDGTSTIGFTSSDDGSDSDLDTDSDSDLDDSGDGRR